MWLEILRKLGALHKAEARLHAQSRPTSRRLATKVRSSLLRSEEFYGKAKEWGIWPDAATYKRLGAVEPACGSLEPALETDK